MSRRKKRGRGKGRTRPRRRHEWIGGRLSPPIFVHDREKPYRPELVIWLAASSGLVVGQDAVAPEDAEGAVARALLAALDRPLAGPKHRPDVIRVADHALAAEVRAAVADTIPVVVAPTPELDTVVKSLIEWMPDTGEGGSYFEGGRIPPEVVAELFTAAEHLYRTAPWKVVADTHTHPSGRRHMALHELDISLTYEIMEFALARFGAAWREYEKDFTDADAVPELSAHWAVYHYRIDGTTALDRYLEEYGQRLPPARSAWLEAEAAAWLSVWEVIEVEPGRSMILRDLLSHEERHVQETTASTMLVTRDAMLARIVDYGGISILGGVHRRPLPSRHAAEVVRRMRGGWLRRKRAMPLDRLRDEAFGRRLIRRWEAAVAKLDERSGFSPDLSNADGDPLLFTTDHFRIAPGAKPMVEARLATLEDVNLPIPEDPAYVFLRPGGTRHGNMGDTVMGRAIVSGETLRLETNSRERADALRMRVETACGDRIRHRSREHADPLPDKAALALPDSAPESLSPVPAQLVLDLKQHHYADWPDQPLPALKGRTPRETARTAEGRAAVDDLLKDMEDEERRSPPGAAFDFSEIRRTLGLK